MTSSVCSVPAILQTTRNLVKQGACTKNALVSALYDYFSFHKQILSVLIQADESQSFTLNISFKEDGDVAHISVTKASFPSKFMTHIQLLVMRLNISKLITTHDGIIILFCEEVMRYIKNSHSPTPNPTLPLSSESTTSSSSISAIKEATLLNLHKHTVPAKNHRVPSITAQVNIDAGLVFNIYRTKSVDYLKLNYPVTAEMLFQEKHGKFKSNGLYNRILASSCVSKTHSYIYGGITRGVLSGDLFRVWEKTITRLNLQYPDTVFNSLCCYGDFQSGREALIISGGIQNHVDASTDYALTFKWSDSIVAFATTSTTTTRHASLTLPKPLAGHASAMDEQYIYIFGGVNDKLIFQNTLLRYKYSLTNVGCDLTQDNVSVSGAIPSARAGAAMCIVNGTLVIVGGHDAKGIVSDQVYLFDTRIKHFERVYAMGPSPYVTHPGGLFFSPFRGSVILCGGYSIAGWEGNVYEFSVSTRQWKLCIVGTDDTLSEASKRPFALMTACNNDIVVSSGLLSTVESKLHKDFYLDYTHMIQEAIDSTLELRCYFSYEQKALALMTFHHSFSVDNSLHDSFILSLKKWFYAQDPATSDVVFTFVDESYKKIYCHRDIIAAQSPFFARLIADRDAEEMTEILIYLNKKTSVKQEEDERIRLHGIKYKHLGNVLEYFYTRSFFIHNHWEDQDIQNIYLIAKLFEEESLQLICTGKLSFGHSAKNNLSTTMSQISAELLIPMDYKTKTEESEEPEEIEPLVIPETENEIAEDIEDKLEELSIASEPATTSTNSSKPKRTKRDRKSFVKFLCIKNFNRHMKKMMEQGNEMASPASPEYLAVKVHKGLITQRIPYFQAMFRSNFVESRQNEVIVDACSMETFVIFLKYVYTGVVPLIQANDAIDLYLLAHQYTLQELFPWIRETIKENISVGVACDVLDIADRMNDGPMVHYCIHTIAKNYNIIIAAEKELASKKPEKKRSTAPAAKTEHSEMSFNFEAALEAFEEANAIQDSLDRPLSENERMVYSFNHLHEKLRADVLAAYVRHYQKK